MGISSGVALMKKSNFGTNVHVWSPTPSSILTPAYSARLLTSFEYQNDDKRIQIVKQASPVAWYNINLKGIYTFELSEKLPDLEELMRTIEGYLPVR